MYTLYFKSRLSKTIGLRSRRLHSGRRIVRERKVKLRRMVISNIVLKSY
jgi:hypothetical protein